MYCTDLFPHGRLTYGEWLPHPRPPTTARTASIHLDQRWHRRSDHQGTCCIRSKSTSLGIVEETLIGLWIFQALF